MSLAQQLLIPTFQDRRFLQSLGNELLLNGDLNWAASALTSWTVQNSSSSVTEVAPGGGAGTGAARLQASAGGVYPRVSQIVASLAAGEWVEAYANCSAFTNGQVDFYSTVSNWGWQIPITAAGEYRSVGPVSQTPAYLYGISTTLDMVFDRLSLRKLTLNELTVVTANSDNRFYFSLPASPLRSESVSLLNRRIDASNYLELRLIRNAANTNWDLRIHRVTAGAQTSNIITAVTSVGDVNGLRMECNGNTITVYTTTDGGGNWTNRGTNTNAANHPTGTGLLPVYVSTVIPSRVEVIPL